MVVSQRNVLYWIIGFWILDEAIGVILNCEYIFRCYNFALCVASLHSCLQKSQVENNIPYMRETIVDWLRNSLWSILLLYHFYLDVYAGSISSNIVNLVVTCNLVNSNSACACYYKALIIPAALWLCGKWGRLANGRWLHHTFYAHPTGTWLLSLSKSLNVLTIVKSNHEISRKVMDILICIPLLLPIHNFIYLKLS